MLKPEEMDLDDIKGFTANHIGSTYEVIFMDAAILVCMDASMQTKQ